MKRAEITLFFNSADTIAKRFCTTKGYAAFDYAGNSFVVHRKMVWRSARGQHTPTKNRWVVSEVKSGANVDSTGATKRSEAVKNALAKLQQMGEGNVIAAVNSRVKHLAMAILGD